MRDFHLERRHPALLTFIPTVTGQSAMRFSVRGSVNSLLHPVGAWVEHFPGRGPLKVRAQMQERAFTKLADVAWPAAERPCETYSCGRQDDPVRQETVWSRHPLHDPVDAVHLHVRASSRSRV